MYSDMLDWLEHSYLLPDAYGVGDIRPEDMFEEDEERPTSEHPTCKECGEPNLSLRGARCITCRISLR